MSWYSGSTLLEMLETVEIQRIVDTQPMRFPVQYVDQPNLDFRGYAGMLASDNVEIGQCVKVLPSGAESSVAQVVTFDDDLQETCVSGAITPVLRDEIGISRGDLLFDAGKTSPTVQSAVADVVWMAGQPLSPGQSHDIKVAGKKTYTCVDNVQYQVGINDLIQRDVEVLPLSGIDLVNLTFDGPLVLGIYQRSPAAGGLVIIDRLANVTIGAGLVREPVAQGLVTAPQLSAFELELNALMHRHFPHWGARDLLGGK